jgi:hypothetical protein
MRLEGQFDRFHVWLKFAYDGSASAFPAISDAMVRLDPRAFSASNCYSNSLQAIHLVSLE